MALLHRDINGRSRGSVLKVIKDQIGEQRFKVAPEGFDRFHSVNGKE